MRRVEVVEDGVLVAAAVVLRRGSRDGARRGGGGDGDSRNGTPCSRLLGPGAEGESARGRLRTGLADAEAQAAGVALGDDEGGVAGDDLAGGGRRQREAREVSGEQEAEGVAEGVHVQVRQAQAQAR